jgi:hypothetical protein
MSSTIKSDSEPLVPIEESKEIKEAKSKETLKHSRHDFAGMLIAAGNTINWKKVILLWLVFIIMNTEIFIDKFLERFDGALYNDRVTMKGVFISSMFLIIAYILIDMLYN